jgi:hypothetical protein
LSASTFADSKPYVLTGKFLSVDGLSACTITPGEIATLEHEVFDHTVEFGSLVSNDLSAWILKTHCQFTEILAGLGDDIVVQLENDTLRGVITNCNVELSFNKRTYI